MQGFGAESRLGMFILMAWTIFGNVCLLLALVFNSYVSTEPEDDDVYVEIDSSASDMHEKLIKDSRKPEDRREIRRPLRDDTERN